MRRDRKDPEAWVPFTLFIILLPTVCEILSEKLLQTFDSGYNLVEQYNSASLK